MRYLLYLFFSLGLLPLTGQTFRASVLLGTNLSQIDGDDLLGFHRWGANGGLRVVAVLGERWRVGPEILFSQLGARRNRGSINISDFRAFRLTTAEVPLMAYYKDWRLVAGAGLSYQRIIDYSVEDAGGQDITATTALREDGLAIKLGITIYLTPNWGMNFRWSKQLTDLQQTDAPSLRTRWLSLRAVYTFGTGEEVGSL